MQPSNSEWDELAKELLCLPVEEGLSKGISLLEQELRSVQVGKNTFLRDVVACDFAAQVLEAGKGVRVLCDSDATRMAYPVAWRGFEAFHDLLEVLVVDRDGETWAADAFVLSVFSIAENQNLLDRWAVEWGVPEVEGKVRAARDVIRDSAEAIGKFSPSASSALLNAVARRERRGGRKKLTAERKSRINLLTDHPDLGAMAQMLQGYWGTLSLQSHPHVRLGSSVRLTPTGLTILLNPEALDEGPPKVGIATTFSAAKLCRDYLRPDLAE